MESSWSDIMENHHQTSISNDEEAMDVDIKDYPESPVQEPEQPSAQQQQQLTNPISSSPILLEQETFFNFTGIPTTPRNLPTNLFIPRSHSFPNPLYRPESNPFLLPVDKLNLQDDPADASTRFDKTRNETVTVAEQDTSTFRLVPTSDLLGCVALSRCGTCFSFQTQTHYVWRCIEPGWEEKLIRTMKKADISHLVVIGERLYQLLHHKIPPEIHVRLQFRDVLYYPCTMCRDIECVLCKTSLAMKKYADEFYKFKIVHRFSTPRCRGIVSVD